MVLSWKRTEAKVVEQCGGDVARAKDHLFGNDATARLYQVAGRADAERGAREKPDPRGVRRIVRL